MKSFFSIGIAIGLVTVVAATNATESTVTTNAVVATTSDNLAGGQEVLTLAEAAALMRVDPATIARLAQGQRIPSRVVGAEWRFSRLALLAWLAGDWQVRTLVDPAGVLSDAGAAPARALNSGQPDAPITPLVSAAIMARGTAPTAGGSEAGVDRPNAPIGAAPDKRTASEVFLRDQRVLLAPNEFTLDIGLLHTRRDSVVLTAVGNVATLANAESKAFTTQLAARYSLFKDTELSASTSYSAQQASLYAGAARLSQAKRSEAGDIGVGVRHTLLHEGPGRPDLIWSLDARIPTGETSRALGTGITLVKSLDPVVVFGTLGYRRTFSRDFADVSRLEPRHRIDLTVGYAFSLNDTLSLNTAISSAFTRGATFTNAELRPSSTSTLQLGMTARVARGLYLQPSLTYRLNGPGSGFTLGLNVPVTF